jgi:hypothetical protein
MSGSYLPAAILVQNDVSRSMQCLLLVSCDIFTTTPGIAVGSIAIRLSANWAPATL